MPRSNPVSQTRHIEGLSSFIREAFLLAGMCCARRLGWLAQRSARIYNEITFWFECMAELNGEGMASELTPCPCCGAPASLLYSKNTSLGMHGWRVDCSECTDSKCFVRFSREAAVVSWNNWVSGFSGGRRKSVLRCSIPNAGLFSASQSAQRPSSFSAVSMQRSTGDRPTRPPPCFWMMASALSRWPCC